MNKEEAKKQIEIKQEEIKKLQAILDSPDRFTLRQLMMKRHMGSHVCVLDDGSVVLLYANYNTLLSGNAISGCIPIVINKDGNCLGIANASTYNIVVEEYKNFNEFIQSRMPKLLPREVHVSNDNDSYEQATLIGINPHGGEYKYVTTDEGCRSETIRWRYMKEIESGDE